MEMLYTIILAVVSYLIGSVNSSILISKAVTGKDIRKSGSGNAGATNMLRTMGKKYAVITLIIDILKGVIAVLAARFAAPLGLCGGAEYIAGVCAVFGHNFPIFFGFKGGKGVATSLGVVLMTDWKIGLVVLAAALLIMAVSKIVSLGSIMAAVFFMVLQIAVMVITKEFDIVRLVCVIALGVLLIARHHANIKRLLNGTENKLGSKKKEQI